MITTVATASVHGVDAFQVNLEADFHRSGIPAFAMVGLVEGAAKEARDRVFAALRSSGFKLPPGRITVNLAPADRKKQGSGFDLPLAVALLAASGSLDPTSIAGFFIAGELSLAGETRPVPGVLPMAVLARDCGAKGLIVPSANAMEASVVEGLNVYPVDSLLQATAIITGQEAPSPFSPGAQAGTPKNRHSIDYADVKGQEFAKRAIEIAAAGGHNIMFIGPPGSGKTMLAKRIPTVLPPLTLDESLEVSKVYSVAGLLEPEQGLVTIPPFRAPHHTVSQPGLVGGGSYPRPGEISLAHCGVLFLDELLEFSRHTLETLRQPMESGHIVVSRAAQSVSYPAKFILAAAMNPCPCGYSTDKSRTCTCSTAEIQRYRSRLSGPLLDRMDIQIEVPAVAYRDLRTDEAVPKRPSRSSAQMAEAIARARKVQEERFKNGQGAAGCAFFSNASLSGKDLEKYCPLDGEAHTFMEQSAHALGLSARACTRIIRLARTIADLEGAEAPALGHLAEAINLRAFDRL